MSMPANPSIYHIVHMDRLPSIVTNGCLWCDAEVIRRSPPGTTIGMNDIKQRRLNLALHSHPHLHVGDCVPFYFCPRSIMLYLVHQANHPNLTYLGGQSPIVHLEADLRRVVAWAEAHGQRWAFTRSNAGAYYFDDWCDLTQLNQIDWGAVQAWNWRGRQDGKQAEFLIERQFPWELVSRIGVLSQGVYSAVTAAVQNASHKPHVEIRKDWYY